MFHVICPECGFQIEIPADAVGPSRTDPWNIAACVNCNLSFDYDDHEVIGQEQPAG